MKVITGGEKMKNDHRELMKYAQAIFTHCQAQGMCNNCPFYYKHECAIQYPDTEWEWRYFERQEQAVNKE